MIEISNERMTATVGDEVIATARLSRYAAVNRNGAWIVSIHPKRPFSRDQAISTMILASLLAQARRRQPICDRASCGVEVVTDRLDRLTASTPTS